MPAVLPSSPPQARRSPGRDSTPDYSLDLDALLLTEESSAIMTPPPMKHPIDVVYSEDIDGPSDFTQNLEFWMSSKLPNVTKPARLYGEAKDDMEEFISSDTDRVGVNASVRRVEEQQHQANHEQEALANEGDGLSFLDNLSSMPDAASTPRTAERIPSLKGRGGQPRVEDHHDDETPTHWKGNGSPINPDLPNTRSQEESQQHGQEEPKASDKSSNIVAELERSLEKLRQELDGVRVGSQQYARQMQDSHESDMESHKQAYEKKLSGQEDVWQKRFSMANTEYEQRLRTVQSRTATEWQIRVEKLSAQLLAREASASELEKKISQQAEQLQDANHEIALLEHEVETMVEKHDSANGAAEKRHERNEPGVEQLQLSLKESETSRLISDAKVATLEAELANLKLLHTREIDELNSKVDDAEKSARQAVADGSKISQVAMSELGLENASLHAQLDEKDDHVDSLEGRNRELSGQLTAVAAERDAALTKLKEQKKLNVQAAREIQSLQVEHAKIKTRLDDTMAAGAARNVQTIQALERQLAEANSARLSADDDVDSARSEAATFKAAAGMLEAEVKDAKSEAEAARSELLVLREDHDVVNRAINGRIKEIMRMREIEWQRRFQVLEKELAMRGQVLLKEWGAKDVGVGEPQPYRYKYV